MTIEGKRFARGAVATPHYLASAVGLGVLADGGNAVDAIVAANLALGVVAPYFCGYGGDLFAIVYDGRDRDAKPLGYRSAGRAPADAMLEMVRSACGSASMPAVGPHTVTVPGAVQGWSSSSSASAPARSRSCVVRRCNTRPKDFPSRGAAPAPSKPAG
jgi:gamma-glutamyltranspeptidase/glutathione hydrolase